ncbi:hypothetical protein NKR19_g5693 [Coniochaeta hoffmannii]|uniref:Uncharacterized protein n=1 Tax=Coniochaeta hoffmannii TaxID=91930 RepID=A0AA38VSA4_9PEZI|nr:hypothetical protein NKR19_g5693 [Coniochaeta hoffmannii]
MQVSADVNAGANANAGHSERIEQSSLDDDHGASQNIVDEEPDNYGVKQADADIGANMEAHDKALKSRVDDGSESATRKGSKKDAPALDGRSKVGEEGDAHDLAQSRQP